MMKITISKIQKWLLAVFFVFSIALGGAFLPFSQPVNAEETTYTQSAFDYFDESKGVSTKYYLDKASNSNTSWPGLRVEMSVKEGVYDATLTYRGSVNPFGRYAFAADSVYDADGKKIALADAVIYSYTSLKDPSKQFSVIAFNRNREGICWYVYALTGVENLEYRNGHVYYVGTEQRAIGRRDNGDYDTNGWTIWSQRDTGIGQIFGSGMTIHIDESTGAFYYNDWNNAGEMTSNQFIEATKAGLVGTQYESACSVAYVQEMLAEMKASGALFSITYMGLKVQEIGFNYIGFYGQDIGSGGKEINVSPYTKNVNTTVYLEEVPQMRMSDIFPRETVQTVYPNEPFVCGFFGTDTWSGNSNWWDTRSNTNQNDALSMYINDVGQYTLISQAYSGYGSNGTPAGPLQVYTLNVVRGIPTVGAVDSPILMKGETHDLKSFFDIWHLGTENETNYAFTVDGAAVGNTYLADGADHEIGVTLTDKYNNVVSYSYEVDGAEISLPTSVQAEGYYYQPVVLPIPVVPAGIGYTMQTYDSNGEFVTDSVVYAFEQSGEYTVKYTILSPFVASGVIEKECAFSLALSHETPAITINGEYEESYYEGKVIPVIDATAQNSVSAFDVDVKVYNGTSEQPITDGKVTLSVGDWRVVYTAQGVAEERTFRVIEDNEKPQIVLGGAYAAEYEKGKILTVLDAFVTDNSGETIVCTVEVFWKDEKMTVENNEFKLEKGGEYKIVYTAVDNAGNVSEKVCEFSVPYDKGIFGGCSGVVGGSSVLMTAAFVGMIMIRRKKNENE